MAISERAWQRTIALTRFDTTSTADLLASLAQSHYARERLSPSMGSNVPDTTPRAITTHFLDTGLGAIIRARI